MVKTIAKILLKRVGTAAAVALVSQGVPEETVTQIVTGLTAFALVMLDFGLEYLERQRAQD
jgi:hypothetical protein